MLKIKEKDLHDLKKKERVTDNFEKVSTDFKNLTIQVNKEKKAEAKKLKRGEKKDFMECLKSKATELECSECEFKVDSVVILKLHVRTDHLKTTFTQTECKIYDDKCEQTGNQDISSENDIESIEEIIEVENGKFNEFKCFYCDNEIKSQQDLAEHRVKCSETSLKFRQNIKPQPYLPASVPNYTQRILGLSSSSKNL